MSRSDRSERSDRFYEKKVCPEGFHRSSSYTTRRGRRVHSHCVRNSSRRKQMRLKSNGRSLTRKAACKDGQIQRRAYVRRFASDIIKRGYTVKRASGKAYRIHPSKSSIYVKPGCMKKRGISKKVGDSRDMSSGESIGPLRKGELKKHGYVYRSSENTRHNALRKAVKEFGPLGVFRKLDAVAKLSVRTVPDASAVFKRDRDWIRRHYELKASE